jgi:hypothetical protein
MPLSNTAICNLALTRIGVQQPIASIDEESAPADALRAVYDHCLETVFRKYPWPFAQRYYTLELVERDPNPEWSFSYRYPTGFLTINRLLPSTATSSSTLPSLAYQLSTISSYGKSANYPQYPYALSSDAAGRLIHTDLDIAEMIGTYFVEDEGMYDPMFTDALAWLLASTVAMGLTKSETIRDYCEQKYAMAGSEGYATSRNELTDRQPSESSFIDARN